MRALIVKTSALGDIVQTYPVVEYLKKHQKVAKLGWVVEKRFASLVRAHPLVDDVIEIDSSVFRSFSDPIGSFREFIRQRREICASEWDVLFDLQANCKSGLCTWLARSSAKVGYGRKTVAEWPNILVTTKKIDPPAFLSIREDYLWMVQTYFQDTETFFPGSTTLFLTAEEEKCIDREKSRWPVTTPVWVFAVGSNWPNKMCSTDTYLEMLKSIKKQVSPYFIFTAGTGEELKEVEKLAAEFRNECHVMYRPELPVLQRVMEQASAVIAVDSLLLHLAATTHTPTFGLFGPSLAKKYAPVGDKRGYFQGECPFQVPFEKRCPFLRTCSEGACLRKVDFSQIVTSLEPWYKTI